LVPREMLVFWVLKILPLSLGLMMGIIYHVQNWFYARGEPIVWEPLICCPLGENDNCECSRPMTLGWVVLKVKKSAIMMDYQVSGLKGSSWLCQQSLK